MPEDGPLPEMREATLQDEDLAALLRDLRLLTEVIEVTVRAAPGANMEGTATIDEAVQLLMERSVRGVRIRYRYDGSEWIDTLMPISEGVRLVRLRCE